MAAIAENVSLGEQTNLSLKAPEKPGAISVSDIETSFPAIFDLGSTQFFKVLHSINVSNRGDWNLKHSNFLFGDPICTCCKTKLGEI